MPTSDSRRALLQALNGTRIPYTKIRHTSSGQANLIPGIQIPTSSVAVDLVFTPFNALAATSCGQLQTSRFRFFGSPHNPRYILERFNALTMGHPWSFSLQPPRLTIPRWWCQSNVSHRDNPSEPALCKRVGCDYTQKPHL